MSSSIIPFLPYGRQSIDDDDVAAVTKVLHSDYLTTGPACPAFEKALSQRMNGAEVVVSSSGTAALHLALLGLGVGEGDTVVVPSITFLASANAVRYVGADVVFADVDPLNGLMTPQTFMDALERVQGRACAVIPVHLGGQCADVQAISEIARAQDMFVVEDACHALGGVVGETPVGACSYSDATCFSFHPVKTIAMGEGGATSFANPEIAQRMRIARSHFMVRDKDQIINSDLGLDEQGQVHPWYYEMPEVGFNYRASDVHCALGLSQLNKLDRFSARRNVLVSFYDHALAEYAPEVRPVQRSKGQTPTWHLYQVLIDFEGLGLSRTKVVEQLCNLGIGTQVHYIPVHKQPYYQKRYGDLDLFGAQMFYAQTLSLPLYSDLHDEDAQRVVAALQKVLGLKSEGQG